MFFHQGGRSEGNGGNSDQWVACFVPPFSWSGWVPDVFLGAGGSLIVLWSRRFLNKSENCALVFVADHLGG